MSARAVTDSRSRMRQAELELPPEENCATIIKQEMCESETEIEHQDEAYVVVVKEEVMEEGGEGQMDTEYLESEEEQYPAYNHDQPFFLHIPEEVRIEYGEKVHATENANLQSPDVIADGDSENATGDTSVSSEEPTERWICGNAPDEKRLLELMQAPPPPLPNPLPYFQDDDLFRCKSCSFSHTLENQCIRHYREKHGPRYLYCFACGSTFAQQGCLYKHEMKNRCRAPGIQVVRRLRLQLKECRYKSKLYRDASVCYLCGAKCDTAKELRQHERRAHVNLRRLRRCQSNTYRDATVCYQCGAKYSTVKELKAHERRVHTDFRRFCCEYCPFAYTNRNSLLSHLQTHASEPSICDYCGKSFIKRDSLILHIRTHQGKRFKCGYCPKRFTQKRSLIAHEARHTGAPPPHPCQFCSSGFWRLAFLKSHMEKVHGYSIITRKKFMDMMPRMSTEEFEDSVRGTGMATFDSTPSQVRKVDGSPDEKLPGAEKSPRVKKSTYTKKTVAVDKSSEDMEKSCEVKKSPVVTPGVEKSLKHKKSPLDNAPTDAKSSTLKKPKIVLISSMKNFKIIR